MSLRIKIDSVDENGNVTGELFHSTLGKGGKGGLTGKIEQDLDFKLYKLQLIGSLISKFGDTWQVTLTAVVGDKALTKGQFQIKSGDTTLAGDFKIAGLEQDK